MLVDPSFPFISPNLPVKLHFAPHSTPRSNLMWLRSCSTTSFSDFSWQNLSLRKVLWQRKTCVFLLQLRSKLQDSFIRRYSGLFLFFLSAYPLARFTGLLLNFLLDSTRVARQLFSIFLYNSNLSFEKDSCWRLCTRMLYARRTSH